MKLIEHSSPLYSPRTYVNAEKAQLTVAFAVDFNTAGEKLTHKAAGISYVRCRLKDPWIECARDLWRACRKHGVGTLNVAGNGIYTLMKHGITQQDLNLYVYRVIAQVHEYSPIQMIVSGGQTGVDLAGAVAAELLGIPCEMTFPKGFKQRYENGEDSDHTEQEIIDQVAYWVGVLSRDVYNDDIPQ